MNLQQSGHFRTTLAWLVSGSQEIMQPINALEVVSCMYVCMMALIDAFPQATWSSPSVD